MSTSEPSDRDARGVQFPLTDGRRSSTAGGQQVLATAVRGVAPALADRIASSERWHREYVDLIGELVAAGVRSSHDALAIARAGLDALRDTLVVATDDGDIPIQQAFDEADDPGWTTATIAGEGDHPKRLEVPYRGGTLAEDALRRQLEDWTTRGIMEPSAAEAVRRVVDEPALVDLSGRTIVVLGATSEMGPYEALCAWGADVLAIDRPKPYLWDGIVATARNGSGRVHAPVRTNKEQGSIDAAELHTRGGADLVTEGPAISAWLRRFGTPTMVGNYAYADGARFVILAAATDAISRRQLSRGTEHGFAYLATPTDVFAVDEGVVEASRRSRVTPIGRSLRAVTGGRMYAPNYDEVVTDEHARAWGLADSLIPQQGPNYALAKQTQRWRAMVSHDDGHPVSANVAPSTATLSVTKNKILAMAYAGADLYDIEVFQPDTSTWLMAALLAHDLHDPTVGASARHRLGDVGPPHAYDLFATGAVHGGLWRMPHQPRTVLPLAALRGLTRPSSWR